MPLTNSFTNFLNNGPLKDSPFVRHNETGESILPPPPISEFRITDAGDQRITDSGDFRITN